jgi:NADPH:quinone reductase-like Zn-dependent oxidoreductase
MSATMQSIRQQAFGGPEVLRLAEVERPVPLPTEVLVRVRAVGVNPVEAVIRPGCSRCWASRRSSSAGTSAGWLRTSSPA